MSSEKHSDLSPAETLNEREGYDDVDVFGHEEEHDVRDFIYLFIYFILAVVSADNECVMSLYMKTDLSIYLSFFLCIKAID